MYFPGSNQTRNVREERSSPGAVNLIDYIVAVWGHEQLTRRSGHARGKGDTKAKGTWIGGVKNSCER
jgi:hypothetical protein